tara:strand:+ start:757 stop:1887 length:1131 start_codon:yes stop_codon:yes gene_type:complete
MNKKKIILYNFIKERVPAPLKKILRTATNKRELFTFLFKFLPPLLIKFLFKFNVKSIKIYSRNKKNIKINVFFKKKSEDPHWVSILISREKNYLNTFNIFFSNSILNYINAMQRTKDCLNLWIPTLIKISQESQKELITFNFDTGDDGHKNLLSMEQKENKNLIPDLYAYKAAHDMNKTISKISFLEFKKNWINKENKIFWRGSTTGKLYSSIEELNKLDRIKICRQFIDKKNIDLKISKIAQNLLSTEKIKAYLLENNLFSEEVSEEKFGHYRYFPDIPGNSLGWGTIHKYLAGNLIFKSKHKKMLAYYYLLKPWVHFIPVESNFSDLEEKFKWSQENIDETIKIAYKGYITIFDYLQNIEEYFMNSTLKYKNKL